MQVLFGKEDPQPLVFFLFTCWKQAKDEPVFDGLNDPFYAVDSRDYQVVQPNHDVLNKMGAKILCIEKERPHVPYERAVMGIRFNEYMIGTQFHPEADPIGMNIHLQTEEKKKTVIENYGEEKLNSMLEQLNDPDKIMWTYSSCTSQFFEPGCRTFHANGVTVHCINYRYSFQC